jgi:RecQ family ATP-dependent DNA helicase
MGSVHGSELLASLQERFGFEAFRPGQLEVLQALLAGSDTLAVLPTGAGKSLCYQLASHLLPGLTLVVSPLIALMKDQVDKLARRGEQGAAFLNSSLGAEARRACLEALGAGRLRLLYVSPEALRGAELLASLRSVRVSAMVVDEAHCISQWGHDFRPDYLALRDAHEQLGAPPLLAATATATARTRQDIVRALGMRDPVQVVLPFDRPNLHLEVRVCHGLPHKRAALRELLAAEPGAAIVYVGRRRRAELLAAELPPGRRAAAYHAGLASQTRAEVQEAFMDGGLDVIVATSAFGMGVDKPDVRLVVHETMPSSLEAYYQEAGRAGRDGLPARAVLLFDPADRAFHESLQAKNALDEERLRAISAALRSLRRGRWIPVPPGEVEIAAHATETQVRVAFSLLERCGALRRVPDCPASAWVRLLVPIGPEAAGTIAGKLAACLGEQAGRGQGLDLLELSETLQLQPAALDEQLAALRRAGLIDYKALDRRLLFEVLRPAAARLELLLSWVARHRRQQRSQLGALAAFGLSRGCRRRAIRGYFGERDVPELCRACDVCRAEAQPVRWSRQRREADWLPVGSLLRFAARQAGSVGRTGMLRLLRRQGAPLEGWARSRAGQLLERLLQADLLRVRFDPSDAGHAWPLLVLSPATSELVRAGHEAFLEPALPRRLRAAEAPAREASASPDAAAAGSSTPSAARNAFRRLKTAHGESVLMLRCGAFYEFREEDAELVARTLGLRLGFRGRCERAYAVTGVPLRRLEETLGRLQAGGHHVQILARAGQEWLPLSPDAAPLLGASAAPGLTAAAASPAGR